jgi:hypothetical protein
MATIDTGIKKKNTMCTGSLFCPTHNGCMHTILTQGSIINIEIRHFEKPLHATLP